MLVIESWPDPGMASAPRVRAASDPAILLDLTRTAIDVVVWGRNVPSAWQEELSACAAQFEGFTLEGTLDQIIAALRDAKRRNQFPVFLMDDVEHTVALAAALAFSNKLVVSLEPLAAHGAPAPRRTAALEVCCCYGGAVSWNLGLPTDAESTTTSVCALVFIPSFSDAEVSLCFAPAVENACGLTILAYRDI